MKGNLEEAHADLARARAAALSGEQSTARQAAEDAQAATSAAQGQTSGVLWRLASRVPVAGDSLRAVAVVAREADVMARRVLPPLLALADSMRPARLRSGGDRVNLAVLHDAAPRLVQARADLRDIRERLSATTASTLPGFVAGPLAQFRDEVDGITSMVAGVANAAELLPPMLGDRQPRRYFVAFQNPAEARGTGGLLGAFGIAEASHGRIRFTHLGVDSELRPLEELPIDLGPSFRALYGADPALWSNANESPHFPYAARLWLAMWERTRGQRLDGVVAVDPVQLSYVLGATGPVSLPAGERISADDVVLKTLSDAYARFATNSAARKRYLLQVSSAVVRRVLTSAADSQALVDALKRGATERRLLVYSAHAEEQRLLAQTSLSGALPGRLGPYAFVVVNNVGADKLDYYLDRRVAYSGTSCSRADGTRGTRVSVTLRTDLSAGTPLPRDITGPLSVTSGHRNDHRLTVALYAATGAALTDLTVDGQRVGFTTGVEQVHPVFRIIVDLSAGVARTVVFNLSEPTSRRRAVAEVQPLVRPQTTVVQVPECRPA